MGKKLDLNVDLDRRAYVTGKLVEQKMTSFWEPLIGTTENSVIYKQSDIGCGDNSSVIFQYLGGLNSAGEVGDGEVCERGDTVDVYNSKVGINLFRWMERTRLRNESCNLGDPSLHEPSSASLTTLYYKHKDQYIFDELSGVYGCAPTHLVSSGTGFGYDFLNDLLFKVKTGEGFFKPNAKGTISDKPTGKRFPLKPTGTNEYGLGKYVLVATPAQIMKLKNDPKYTQIMSHAEVRGSSNPLINGVVASHQGITIIESPSFFGNVVTNIIEPVRSTKIVNSGLRRYAVGPDGKMYWEGEKQFDKIEALAVVEARAKADAQKVIDNLGTCCTTLSADDQTALDNAVELVNAPRTNAVYSRALLLGASALQLATGKPPVYKAEPTRMQKSFDSMLEVYMGASKTVLTKNLGQDDAKASNIDFGAIAIDMEEI